MLYLLAGLIIAQASAAKRVQLENGNIPTEPTLSEADRAAMDVFFQNILGLLPVLGIHAFEQSTGSAAKAKSQLLFCKGNRANASGYDTPQGFVVKSGSQASSEMVQSLKQWFPHIVSLRAGLLNNGVLLPDGDKLIFQQDYTFNSPSQASAVVLGRPSNGRTDWQDSKGRTLKAIQTADAVT